MKNWRLVVSLVAWLACLPGAGVWAQSATGTTASGPAAAASATALPYTPADPAAPIAPATAEAKSGAHTAAAAHRKAEHDRIRHEREAVKAQRVKDEAACYKLFAAEDCLKTVRAQVRDTETRLRAQEIELNDAERKEKAADRLKSIEEKQRPVPANTPKGTGPDAVLRNKPAADPQATKAQRDHDAELRAQQQRSNAQKHAQEQQTRAAENAVRASQSRAKHAEALQAADERRARVEKAQADAAAQGRKPAAPLPAAPVAPQ